MMLDPEKFHFNNMFFHTVLQLGDIRLLQIGDRLFPAGSVVAPHKNVCLELTYVYSGKAKVWHDDKQFQLVEGDICLTLPEIRHSIKADYGEDLRFFFLGFELTEKHYLYKEFKKLSKWDADNIVVKDSFSVADYFIRALNEFISPSRYSDHITGLNVEYIVTYFFQSLFPAVDGYDVRPKSANEILVYNIINYLDNNTLSFSGNIELERHFGYSISHISHTFSKIMGQTINHYVIQRKLNYAKRMLLTNKTITGIAAQLGYNSIHSFSKAFKNAFGVSPGEYREQALNEKRLEPVSADKEDSL